MKRGYIDMWKYMSLCLLFSGCSGNKYVMPCRIEGVTIILDTPRGVDRGCWDEGIRLDDRGRPISATDDMFLGCFDGNKKIVTDGSYDSRAHEFRHLLDRYCKKRILKIGESMEVGK
jgi:hypothetical protein